MVRGISIKEKVSKAQFNLRFMLALDCYMPSVARLLMKDCKEDIEFFGFEYAQKKWVLFIINSLTGGVQWKEVSNE